MDILDAIDRPYDGITAYSTIGLSDYSIGYSVDEKPLRIEIVGASDTIYEFFPNILSTCAFSISLIQSYLFLMEKYSKRS